MINGSEIKTLLFRPLGSGVVTRGEEGLTIGGAAGSCRMDFILLFAAQLNTVSLQA